MYFVLYKTMYPADHYLIFFKIFRFFKNIFVLFLRNLNKQFVPKRWMDN